MSISNLTMYIGNVALFVVFSCPNIKVISDWIRILTSDTLRVRFYYKS